MFQLSTKLPPFLKHAKHKKIFLALLFAAGGNLVQAQQIINNGGNIVMSGAAYMVVNNASFINNGTFTPSTSTVSFTGSGAASSAYSIGTNATTSLPTAFYNLTISNTANTIIGTVNPLVSVANTLSVTAGSLAAAGNLTLLSTASNTANVSSVGGAITGNVNVQRYINAQRAWRLLTAPVTGANSIFNTWQNGGVYTAGTGIFVTGAVLTGNGIDGSTRNTPSVKTWNYLTPGFSVITNTKTSNISNAASATDIANVGYFVFIRGDRNPNNISSTTNTNATTITSVGALQTGSRVFNIAVAASPASNYVLLGNPYASPIDFTTTTLSNLVNRFYSWDPALNTVGGYVLVDCSVSPASVTPNYNKTGGTGTTSQTKIIQSGQAFFVQTNSIATASSITFNESSKTTNAIATNANIGFRPLSPVNLISSLTANIFLLDADSTIKLADGNLTKFDSKYSDSVSIEDAYKFTNINECFAVTRHGATLAMEARPNLTINDTVFLKLWKTTQRAYRFQFEPGNLNNTNLIGTLQDSYLTCSKTISLTDTTTVDFTVDANAASAVADRFQIIFKIFKPFAFTNITAMQKDNTIPVNWTVAYETNITQYEVQKSTDSVNFTKVATQLVAGTNNATNSYNWIDVNAITGDNFYRVKMIAQDGSTRYTKIVKVNIAPITSGIFIYPNPVKNSKINIQMGNQPVGTYQLVLTNNIGQVVYTGTVQNTGNNTQFAITLSNKAAKGMYNLQISSPSNKVSTQKIIVE